MVKIFFRSFTLLAIAVTLSACSSLSLTGISRLLAPTSQSQSSTIARLSLQDKMGIGILNLENTNLALTSDQAAALLPLWKGVKTLSNNKTMTEAEISAIYQQIQAALTPDQIQMIENQSWTQTDLSALTQKYGVHNLQDSQSGVSAPTQSSQAQVKSNPGMDAAMGMGDPMSGGDFQVPTSPTKTSPTVSLARLTNTSANQYNILFADTLINLLQKVANAG
jgi:hypothetical protein